MSIPVALADLATTMAKYRFAYLLVSSDAGAPRVVAVNPVLENGIFSVPALGRRTCESLLTHPDVALVWPPLDSSDHSLICDGRASVRGTAANIKPLHAVLHRPAPPVASKSDGQG